MSPLHELLERLDTSRMGVDRPLEHARGRVNSCPIQGYIHPDNFFCSIGIGGHTVQVRLVSRTLIIEGIFDSTRSVCAGSLYNVQPKNEWRTPTFQVKELHGPTPLHQQMIVHDVIGHTMRLLKLLHGRLPEGQVSMQQTFESCINLLVEYAKSL